MKCLLTTRVVDTLNATQTSDDIKILNEETECHRAREIAEGLSIVGSLEAFGYYPIQSHSQGP